MESFFITDVWLFESYHLFTKTDCKALSHASNCSIIKDVFIIRLGMQGSLAAFIFIRIRRPAFEILNIFTFKDLVHFFKKTM